MHVRSAATALRMKWSTRHACFSFPCSSRALNLAHRLPGATNFLAYGCALSLRYVLFAVLSYSDDPESLIWCGRDLFASNAPIRAEEIQSQQGPCPG